MSDFKKGMCLLVDGKLMKILEAQHVKPGKGGAFMRTKFKDLSTGNVLEKTVRENEKFEEARVETQDMQLLYTDATGYHFMNQQTYEQVALNGEDLGDAAQYLKENDVAKIDFYNGDPIGVELPAAAILEVMEADPAVKGNTATGASKKAKLETGLVIQVPLFIEIGEKIKVDTRTGAFLSRA